MPSFLFTTLVLFISFFTEDASGWHRGLFHRPTYQLTEPVRLAVESDQGMITSYLYPDQRFHIGNPNNNLICHHLQRDGYTAFLVPPDQHHVFKKQMVSYFDIYNDRYSNQLSRYLSSLGSDGEPWLIFLKSDGIQISSNVFERAHLRSVGTRSDWEIDVLKMNSSDEKVNQGDVDYPDENLSAPPPSYQSLCVGPEYPKPYPVFYSFPVTTAHQTVSPPGLSNFNIADVIPAVFI